MRPPSSASRARKALNIAIPEGQEKEAIASAKMSKSKPDTCIFIYDTPAEIKQKLSKSFCPERIVRFNPVLDICKYIIFRENPIFIIERPAKFGGNIQFENFNDLAIAYTEGKLHPMDLKNAVAEQLGKILEPVRRYFATHKEAQECLETIRNARVTR